MRETSRLDAEGSAMAGAPPTDPGTPDPALPEPQLPVDPDLPEEPPARRHGAGLLRGRSDILAVIACGGALGSAARYGVAEALPHQPGTLAWSTFLVNIVGGFLLGLLMVFVMDVWPPSRFVRPFFGVGVLGGFTTFSTYMVDTHAMLAAGEVKGALTYVLGTLFIGLAAVWLGVFAARWMSTLPRRRHAGTREEDVLARPEGASDDA